MSAATIRPASSQSGPVKSSSVISATLPFRTPAARTLPSVGRLALWMKSVCGWATPFSPPGRPPPATSTGSHGCARRTASIFGSRHLPLVAYPSSPPRPDTHAKPWSSTLTSCE